MKIHFQLAHAKTPQKGYNQAASLPCGISLLDDQNAPPKYNKNVLHLPQPKLMLFGICVSYYPTVFLQFVIHYLHFCKVIVPVTSYVWQQCGESKALQPYVYPKMSPQDAFPTVLHYLASESTRKLGQEILKNVRLQQSPYNVSFGSSQKVSPLPQ